MLGTAELTCRHQIAPNREHAQSWLSGLCQDSFQKEGEDMEQEAEGEKEEAEEPKASKLDDQRLS